MRISYQTHLLSCDDLRSQPRDLGFERRDASVALGERGGDIGGLEALRDVLRAVGVPGRRR